MELRCWGLHFRVDGVCHSTNWQAILQISNLRAAAELCAAAARILTLQPYTNLSSGISHTKLPAPKTLGGSGRQDILFPLTALFIGDPCPVLRRPSKVNKT